MTPIYQSTYTGAQIDEGILKSFSIPTPTIQDNGKAIIVDNGAYTLGEVGGGGAGTLYKHDVQIEGTDETDFPLEDVVYLTFYTSSSTPYYNY